MSKSLSRDTEHVVREWLCNPQGSPDTAGLRYGVGLLLKEAEAEIKNLRENIEAVAWMLDHEYRRENPGIERPDWIVMAKAMRESAVKRKMPSKDGCLLLGEHGLAMLAGHDAAETMEKTDAD